MTEIDSFSIREYIEYYNINTDSAINLFIMGTQIVSLDGIENFNKLKRLAFGIEHIKDKKDALKRIKNSSLEEINFVHKEDFIRKFSEIILIESVTYFKDNT